MRILIFMVYKVVQLFKSVDEILVWPLKSKTPAVLSCGAVCHAVQGSSTFQSLDEILNCDHLNERNWAVLSYGAV